MADITPINEHLHVLASEIREECARIRQKTAEAAAALKLPKPDTFLGRRTYEPFPEEPKE
ncbi:hypothetical protein I6F33_36720 [Bradyrhizobium sp. BRP20]|uniref:hypothetical protein n=1 Tax=Bradyrhizobium sp. BRP20 TaxID=2793822 RepID=UPI001CD30E10|nr:hypothetical protein [Bradyrhizobium sp. BRP20]MCA1438442.1 hypothetical protein [Bradyrhizobium sp. BRP20]